MRRDTIANYIRPVTAINRLLALADMIRDKVPKRQFEIGSYRCDINNRGLNLKPSRDIKIGCNTAGCIAGWGVVIAPELRFSHGNIVNDRLKLNNQSHRSFGAAFGLTNSEAWNLCLENLGSKDTPKKAAQAVDDLAADLAEYHGYDIVKTNA